MDSEILKRAARIKILLMDCDGVLTDGRLWLTPEGDEQKAFHVRDGQGIKLLHEAGIKTGVVSGRSSSVLERRAEELGIAFVRQGAQDKVILLDDILAASHATPAECAYIGDDIGDIPLMQRVGFAVAVADAAAEAREAAHYVTSQSGGHGAVREICDLILRAQRR